MIGGATRTWWGQAFLDLIPPKTALAVRDRGRVLARDGLVGELHLAPGRVHAHVGVGGRAADASITLPTWTAEQCEAVLDVLAARLVHTAALADSRLDPSLARDLDQSGLSLLPPAEEVAWTDSGDTEGIGRSAAGLHHAVTQALEADPFVLLGLRGLGGRDETMAALRRRRAGDQAVDDGAVGQVVDDTQMEDFWAAGDLGAIVVHPHPPATSDLVLDRLGTAPRVDDMEPVRDLVLAAAGLAWKLAAGEGSGAADDEMLLAELRAARMATASSLAETLGWDVDVVIEALDRLYGDGAVLRTGQGDRTRYRAV